MLKVVLRTLSLYVFMLILTYQSHDLNIIRIINNSIYDKRDYEVTLPVEISRSYLRYFIISSRNVQLSKFFTSLYNISFFLYNKL